MTGGFPSVTRIKLEQFTAFNSLDLRPSSGINVSVGANGTGKTHIMKVAYAACEATKDHVHLAEKLTRLFMPADGRIGRLVKRKRGGSLATAEVQLGTSVIRTSFSSLKIQPRSASIWWKGWKRWEQAPLNSVYIPVKEMLANAPGFRSLYAERRIHFEETYRDVLDRAYLPPPHGAPDAKRRKLLEKLRKVLEGRVRFQKEEFYLKSQQGRLEFSLLAEGLRKLGLLWLLIQNGTLPQGSVLFWDEPETNLNPRLFGPVIEILLELQRMGVQIFVATHDYLILKQLDLQATDQDQVQYHVLHRHESSRKLQCNTVDSYLEIDPNAIDDAFGEIYDLEIQRSIGHHQ